MLVKSVSSSIIWYPIPSFLHGYILTIKTAPNMLIPKLGKKQENNDSMDSSFPINEINSELKIDVVWWQDSRGTYNDAQSFRSREGKTCNMWRKAHSRIKKLPNMIEEVDLLQWLTISSIGNKTVFANIQFQSVYGTPIDVVLDIRL